MNGAVCPCAVCEERFVGCHAECDAYKAWHEAHKAEREKRRKHVDRADLLTKFRYDSITQMKRRHGR